MTTIQQYWDLRAKESRGAPSATTNDIYLRELETAVLVRELRAGPLQREGAVLDVGCGDGRTTLAIARQFPGVKFWGIDFSREMIAAARDLLARESDLPNEIMFSIGDARDLHTSIGSEKFHAIITNRCLINLGTRFEQYHTLREISCRLLPGGCYLGTENFNGGQRALNELRRSAGVPEIPVRWHNLYFDEQELVNELHKSFRAVELIAFSSTYYYVTRIVYSALCQLLNEEPSYDHPIYKIAVKLPPFGDFSPIKLIRAQI
jgi:SAM-dependent methyltransferase